MSLLGSTTVSFTIYFVPKEAIIDKSAMKGKLSCITTQELYQALTTLGMSLERIAEVTSYDDTSYALAKVGSVYKNRPLDISWFIGDRSRLRHALQQEIERRELERRQLKNEAKEPEMEGQKQREFIEEREAENLTDHANRLQSEEDLFD